MELLAQNKANASTSVNEEVNLDELMDVSEPCIFIICLLLVSKNVFLQDPELEKLHADRIAALKKDAEKRQKLKMQGHGEYREITEADFLGEVTASEKVICHFYHREFYRCKNGVATDRLVGFHDLGGKDDFPTRTLELFLLKKGMIEEKKRDEEDDDYLEGQRRSVRSSAPDSDSD